MKTFRRFQKKKNTGNAKIAASEIGFALNARGVETDIKNIKDI